MTPSEVAAAWAVFALGCVLGLIGSAGFSEGARGPWRQLQWLGIFMLVAVAVRVMPVRWGH